MTDRLHRTIAVARTVSLVGLAAFVVHTVVPDGTAVASTFDDWVYYALSWLAVALCVARVVLVERNRGGWAALTVALALWAAGDFYYAHWVGTQAEPPFPSLADAGYLAFYPFAFVGFVLLFRARVTRLPAGIWIDGVTAALAVAAVGAAVVLEVVLRSTSGTFSAVATNLAYPLGDMILLALVVGAFALTGWRPGRAWLALGLALALNAVGDGVYLYVISTNNYREGTLLDATWPAAMVLLANAAWVPPRAERAAIDTEGRQLLGIPACCTALALSVLVLDHFERLNGVALVLAACTLGGVTVRLAVSFRENRRLLELSRSEAVTDALTGLGNRRLLMSDLERAAAASTSAVPWLLVVFDLDGFKGYNDAFGHPAGDALLRRLGARLEAVAGAGTAYRLGGDEFCLLAPVGPGAAGAAIDAAVDALADRGEGFAIGTSFGAVFLPDDAAAPREALGEADARLYAQKHRKHARRDRPHEALLQALHEREPDLRGHTTEVTALALAAGRRLGLDERELEQLERAAQLHDVGKIAVPDQILHKPDALTPDEWRFVRKHTLVGQRILAASPALRRVGDVVRATHERWDGDGYPDGLAGEEIPLAARVIAVCDAYDAMMAARPYRPARTHDQAVAELRRCAGTQFDPAVVEVVLGALRERAVAG